MKPASWELSTPDWTAVDALAAGRRLVADSRLVEAGDVFLASPGVQSDGRQYIDVAVARGAAAVLWEPEGFVWPAHVSVPNLAVPGLTALTGIVLGHVLGNPGEQLWTVGVTGTNGKTSTAHWLAQAFTALGKPTALLGTLGYGLLDQLEEPTHTTPPALAMQPLLRKFVDAGATHLAMEVSSHALEQGRAHGVCFDVALFTNLTLDHLDYHGTMAAYGEAKARLFQWEGLKAAVINADDAFGAELLKRGGSARFVGYGLEQGDIRATSLQLGIDGVRMEVDTPWGKGLIQSSLIGRFNAYNLLGCLGVLLVSDVPLDIACATLSSIRSAVGRMDRLGGGNQPLVVVDYAHTPDALEKALETLRETLAGEQKLLCVFGCGGDRDRSKRPVMGELACRLADQAFVTSDNPRTEQPDAIIADILAGVPADVSPHVNADRAEAIAAAIAAARAGDIVLIAGKGHEAYQDVAGVKRHFSDHEETIKALKIWAEVHHV
ncbi:UDP-N-acetylmuramoyl-L-alanyl-D-glutamate--2,6-diaminopimelate ligase [Burkholderiaceae bacterium DAT-1]|nr:UDP-N-acetylmuramoyl-L-alanyl-D-glutamate--2,6-diaminopimelate ligase [Burkholderiaceae bacterium DAT-1]